MKQSIDNVEMPAVIGEETETPSRNKSCHHIGPYGSSEEVGR